MTSNVDKIVATFSKTVRKLRAEADILNNGAKLRAVRANTLLEEADIMVEESNRAVRIADRLEEIVQ